MGTDAFGTSIEGMRLGLEHLGFIARTIYIDMDSFAEDDFTLPAIARLVRDDGTAHFVTVYRIRKGTVTYMDPARDKVQKKSLEDFNEDFDGGLIMMVPSQEFIESKGEKRNLFTSFFKMIRPHAGWFAVAIVMSVMLTVFGIVVAVFNKVLIDEIIPYHEDSQLLIFGIALVLVVLVQIIVAAFRAHIVLYLSQKIDIPLMLGYFGHVFRLPIGFFESRRTGDIVTRFQDAGVVKDILTSTALTLAIDVSMVAIVGVVLASLSPNLFGVTLIMAGLSAILVFLFRSPYRKLNRRSMEQNARLNSQVIESLNNIEAVKIGGSEEHIMENIEAEYIKALRIAFKGGVLSNVQTSASSAITGIGNLMILLYGGALAMGGDISLGTMIAFMTLSGYFIDPIGRLVSLQISIQEAGISLSRLSEILDVEEENESESRKDELDERIEEVAFSDVSFGYGTRPAILSDIDVRIGPGEKVALVGRSGCGKTTLSKLLLRFYEPKAGTITVNGRDIAEIGSFSLRKRIGCVPQNVQTFSGTIRENLLMGTVVSKQELERVCDITGCSEFIRRLPAGYDTMLDEAGGGLSGGEKQRIVIARAILRNPDFLILDEATSNMDFITEKMTFDLIFKHMSDVPMLIIAHRLSTIRSCDRIYVMESGRIVESGTHDDLIQLDGLYHKLWLTQMGSGPLHEEDVERSIEIDEIDDGEEVEYERDKDSREQERNIQKCTVQEVGFDGQRGLGEVREDVPIVYREAETETLRPFDPEEHGPAPGQGGHDRFRDAGSAQGASRQNSRAVFLRGNGEDGGMPDGQIHGEPV